jgi:hypothetical protein
MCDADGFFQLVSDLAELYRGIQSSDDPTSSLPSLAHPPHIRSYMSELSGGNVAPEERLATLDFQPSLFHVEKSAEAKVTALADAPSSSTATSVLPSPPPNTGRFLHFSSRELRALKALATDPTATSSSGNWVSTFDALSAHLYQRVYQARLKLRVQDANQIELSPPDFLTPVNLRSRFGPNILPPNYFPNFTISTCASLPPDLLASGPLWKIAKALHDITRTTATTSKDEITQTIRWIGAQPDKLKIRQGFRFGNGMLAITQWNKIDKYASAVFEVPPVLVAPPFTPISLLDGLGYFLPSVGGDMGAIEVALSLSEPLWSFIEQDEPILN